MQKRYKTYEDEFELRCLETELAAELNMPYVRCEYDGNCSHKVSSEELDYRRKEGILDKNEYVINYEIYNTKEDRDRNEGGVDGEVHELIYAITKGTHISIRRL